MWKRRKDWRPEEVLAQQLAMNRQTWKALQSQGVTEDTELRLDFTYEGSDRDSADALATFLKDETDYDVRVEAEEVKGSTQGTTVSAEILDQWVKWMVLAGYENGRCKFDGWGTAVT
jgi:hypothetical protein